MPVTANSRLIETEPGVAVFAVAFERSQQLVAVGERLLDVQPKLGARVRLHHPPLPP
jgi:hypothetical protein